MAENLGKWLSKRGPVTKIMPSIGCKGDIVPLALGRWYDSPEFDVIWGMSINAKVTRDRRAI